MYYAALHIPPPCSIQKKGSPDIGQPYKYTKYSQYRKIKSGKHRKGQLAAEICKKMRAGMSALIGVKELVYMLILSPNQLNYTPFG